MGGPPKKPLPGAPRDSDIQLPAGAVMPRRKLGRTGVEVSAVGLGGFHIGLPEDEQTAIRLIRMAVDHDITFMDNCWDYNDGKSHVRMGRALRDGYRQKVFLMTKIDGRTKQAAAAQIDQSLRALETDVIDLVQIHEVIRMSDAERVFGPSGAIEALVAAKKAGKLRFIGFTGHKNPDIHLKMLNTAFAQNFRFDTVQMPLNVMDAHYQSFQHKVLPVLIEHEIGVLGMKPLGSGLFFRSKPLVDGSVTASDCLHYSMSLPTSVVITGCDTVGILKQALLAAYTARPLAEPAMKSLLARTASAADRGTWEKYKTSDDFDGTAKHPWWLETASVAKAT
ncbi:MAG TPA: aldo/keto reductase [Polyangia bacterium]|jgi:aryl-alcohol dehydrogenase-like predicted oxidoreductase|nr:aldo/keto reductase [Polyangia bacterium]